MQNKQQKLWLLAAMVAPLAQFSGAGWLNVLLAVLAVLPLSRIPKHWERLGKPEAVIQVLWLGIVAGGLLGYSALNWPSDNDLAVPLTILVLAVLTTRAAAPRIGTVVAFCMALLAVPAAVSGAKTVEIEWLRPELGPWQWGLTLVLLLPNLPVHHQKKGLVRVGVLAVLLSALVQGTISAGVASAVRDPFYQSARTLGYLEPVIAACLTLGWYALGVYLLSSADALLHRGGLIASGIAAISILFRVRGEGIVWVVTSAVLWLVIPFLKSKKKNEKR